MKRSFLSGLFGLVLAAFITSCSQVPGLPFQPPESKKANLFRGSYHVHSKFSHDSKAPLHLIAKSAKKAGLDFVVVMDHNNINAKRNYRHLPEDPLLLFGVEVSTWNDGHLGVIQVDERPPDVESTQEMIDWVHERGGFTVLAHPFSKLKPWTNWNLKGIDGIELFCLSDLFYEDTVRFILKGVFFPSSLFLKSTLKLSPEAFAWWDDQLSQGLKVTGFAATDAHLKWRLDHFYVENFLLPFQAVTLYVESKELNDREIIQGLAHGKSFFAFEIFGLAQDFEFTATANQLSATLNVRIPKEADIRLIHNRNIVARKTGKALEYAAPESGYYRVEVYLNKKPWIFSNPIYLEESVG